MGREYEPTAVEALEVVLDEIEAVLDDGRATHSHVALGTTHDRLTTDCDDPSLRRLEHAPHHVYLGLSDEGGLEKIGENELLDSPWAETASYWCRTCDAELEGKVAAVAHANGIDLSGGDLSI